MTKISELPDGIQAVPGDLFAAVRGGVTHQIPFPDAIGDLGILRGIPDTLTLDAKAVIVNYAGSDVDGLFTGNVDAVNGEMTIPKTGLYALNFLAIGTMASPAINQTSLMYYRLSNAGAQDGDYLVAVSNVNSNMIDNASWSATLTRSLPIGAIISLVLEGSTNLGLFTFVETTFEVHLI